MRRILLKLSGEALAGEKHMGFDEETVRGVALQVKKLVDEGYEIGIVTGGGSFWRGRSSANIDRTKADKIAGYRYELHLCIGNLPFRRHADRSTDALCMRLLYKAVFQGQSQ